MSYLRSLRLARNLTLQGLGARSGVDFRIIQRIETGRIVPTILELTRLADALGCELNEITDEPAAVRS